jgi:ribosome biogenesis protein ENP2
MKLTTHGSVPVYTIAGASTARPLPEWLARKRKRSLKKDSEYANRIELLQDFEFEEASACTRVSQDGEWVMSTGTYKPQIHVHYLPHLSLSYARHTNTINQTFILLSSDYSKSLHLQTDRFLEFHTPGGLHTTSRIPRYGRDLKYNNRTAEALIPAVGVNADGLGEVFRLNLELGRFMKAYEVEVGGDDFSSMGGGALQGGINVGAVNCAAIAEESHGLLAFGTSIGTVECWDSRSRNRISTLGPPPQVSDEELSGRSEITALAFHRSGLNMAVGDSNGMIRTYDLRSPVPLSQKSQGYDFPIQNLSYVNAPLSSDKILSADKKCIKIWDVESGDLWANMEPAVDLNHVEWVPDSGMLLTANEGRQQHSFLIPQLGPAPRWCAFLDNLVEEMAEDGDDPNAFKSAGTGGGEVYDNYKFLDMKQLRELSLDHLVGTTNLLRPYMHGYFVAQRLYEQARLLTNPDMVQQQRQKSIQEKINKERESRIRGQKKVAVKVNRRFAEALAAKEEARENRRAQRLLRKGQAETPAEAADDAAEESAAAGLVDDRFRSVFENEDFEIDENSREYALSKPTAPGAGKGRSDVMEGDGSDLASEDSEEDHDGEDVAMQDAAHRQRSRKTVDDLEASKGRIGSSSYHKSGKRSQQKDASGPTMRVTSSSRKTGPPRDRKGTSFGDLKSSLPRDQGHANGSAKNGDVFGEKEITFAPAKAQKKSNRFPAEREDDVGRSSKRGKERRSASGNVFRRM